MVLAELGSKITSALRSLNSTTVIDEEVLAKVLKDISLALLGADVNVRLVHKLRDNIKLRVNLEDVPSGTNKRRLIQRAVFDELVSMVKPEREPYKMQKGKSNVVMFVGLQGSGKTTTIAKFANHYRRKGWKVAMVCADTFRAGAFDQLKQNATRVKVPFYGSYTEPDPVRIAEEGVAQFRRERYEVIIVDTSGRHKQEASLFEEMQQVQVAVQPDDIVFVMDSTIGQAAVDQATAFKEAVQIGSVVMTKLDGHAKGGGALSAVAATDSPILFIGTGEHFDDFEPFDAESFVRRLLGMGDVGKLLEEIKETGILDENSRLVQRIGEGQFTLRDMYEQFQSVMKLGPLNRVMSMIPGLPQELVQRSQGDEGGNRIKRFLFIMDSMTDAELDDKAPMDESRVRRIAIGSGTSLEEVYFLLKSHKQMSRMVGKIGKSKLMKGGDSNLVQQMTRNPNAVMQQLTRSMDPNMLRQIGGPQTMMNLMKEMGSMDLGELQGALGGMAGGGAGGMGGMAGLAKQVTAMKRLGKKAQRGRG